MQDYNEEVLTQLTAPNLQANLRKADADRPAGRGPGQPDTAAPASSGALCCNAVVQGLL